MIRATIIADSISAHTNQRITTFELEYPQFIHAQLLSHRQFSITDNSIFNNNITIDEMIEMARTGRTISTRWGNHWISKKSDNIAGAVLSAINALCKAKNDAIKHAKNLQALGLNKHVVSRVLAPFQITKAVVTATSFESLFGLRCHKDTQPEVKWLADLMYEAMQDSTPEILKAGEYHTPYVQHERDVIGTNNYGITYYVLDDNGSVINLVRDEAIKISCSCVAQVGNLTHDTSIEKASTIHRELIVGGLPYANAFEHCATPIDIETTSEGITHFDINDIPYSGNFANWAQIKE